MEGWAEGAVAAAEGGGGGAGGCKRTRMDSIETVSNEPIRRTYLLRAKLCHVIMKC